VETIERELSFLVTAAGVAIIFPPLITGTLHVFDYLLMLLMLAEGAP